VQGNTVSCRGKQHRRRRSLFGDFLAMQFSRNVVWSSQRQYDENELGSSLCPSKRSAPKISGIGRIHSRSLERLILSLAVFKIREVQPIHDRTTRISRLHRIVFVLDRALANRAKRCVNPTRPSALPPCCAVLNPSPAAIQRGCSRYPPPSPTRTP
jgi:hypothetical protein